MKPHQNMTYDTSPGPGFYVDSGSEVRIPIFCLASDIAYFLCINGANYQFSHGRCSTCHNCYHCSQGIASDRNPLMTCTDFDHISPILGNIMTNNIMQCIEHITFDGYSKSQNSLPQNSKYW